MPRVLRTSSFRLAALYALLFALSTGLLFGIVYWIASDGLREQMRLSIESEMSGLEATASEDNGSVANEIRRRLSGRRSENFYYGLHEPSGRLIAGNLPVAPAAAGWRDLSAPTPQSAGQSADQRDEPDTVLLALVHRLEDGRLLSVALDTFRITEAQEAIMRAFAWAAAAGLTLALLGGVSLSQAFLRRIDELNRAARSIVAGNLAERIRTDRSGDELDQLGDNLNEMLDRLQASMEGLKQVSSDIAHDLRTPLSRLHQRLETTQQTATTRAEYEAAVEEALSHARVALDIFGALLRIAQIESGTRRESFADTNLSHMLAQLEMTYAPVAEDLGKTLMARLDAGVTVLGDRELLMQLFVNVIENALRHTPDNARIEIRLTHDGDAAIAEVRDDGPGIPASERERVLRRFYRLESSRSTPGSGLGLALVAAVAKLHGAELLLADNRPGLAVRLRFAGTGAR